MLEDEETDRSLATSHRCHVRTIAELNTIGYLMDNVGDLQARLAAEGNPAKKEWWERYLKGAIEFYGVPMAQIRRLVHVWHADHDLDAAELRAASLTLLAGPVAEDKLAGILIMQELLLPADQLKASRDLPQIASVFDAGHVADWNTTDWLCVRVLGPLIEKDGRATAELIARWSEARGLWRRRAAAVAFVPLAGRGDAVFPGLADLVLGVCARNVTDRERFAQTGVGWVLRELSDAVPDAVYSFVQDHNSQMSREAVRMASARLPDAMRRVLGIAGQRRRR